MSVLSCIVYGMAFDFFNISGSLFVEQQSDSRIRASAQGLFMVMTNGVGAVFGSLASGFLIEHFFTTAAGRKDWHGIWVTFALYALAMAQIGSAHVCTPATHAHLVCRRMLAKTNTCPTT